LPISLLLNGRSFKEKNRVNSFFCPNLFKLLETLQIKYLYTVKSHSYYKNKKVENKMKKTIKLFGIGAAVLMILVIFSPVMSADPPVVIVEEDNTEAYGCIWIWPWDVVYQLYKNIKGWPYYAFGTPL